LRFDDAKSQRLEKPHEHDDVKAASELPFVEGNAAMNKSLRFWIGMTAWIAPPLLVLSIWAIF
jgi:hypothetical protein